MSMDVAHKVTKSQHKAARVNKALSVLYTNRSTSPLLTYYVEVVHVYLIKRFTSMYPAINTLAYLSRKFHAYLLFSEMFMLTS